MKDDKHNRQQLACEFIHDNYVAFNRLRFDEIAQKVQLQETDWRYITNADINSMVCDCCAETGANITSREILTVLNAGSAYIPRVHPLREYILSLRPYTPDQPDWIDFVASQVRVRDSAQDIGRGYAAMGRSQNELLDGTECLLDNAPPIAKRPIVHKVGVL